MADQVSFIQEASQRCDHVLLLDFLALNPGLAIVSLCLVGLDDRLLWSLLVRLLGGLGAALVGAALLGAALLGAALLGAALLGAAVLQQLLLFSAHALVASIMRS